MSTHETSEVIIPSLQIVKSIWSQCPEDNSSEYDLKKIIKEKEKIIKEKTVRNVELEGEIVRLHVDNIRWQNDIVELEKELEFYKNAYFHGEDKASSDGIIRYRFPVYDDRIIERMTKNGWLELNRIRNSAKIKAKKFGEEPWCQIILEDVVFVLSSYSINVNEHLQHMMNLSVNKHKKAIHRELKEKKEEKKEDKEKTTGYTNKPTITIPEEPKNIKGVCWMCFDNVTDTQKRVKAKKNGIYHYSHYDCLQKSISKKTRKSTPSSKKSKKLEKRINDGHCNIWWSDPSTNSIVHDFKIKWADNVLTDTDDSSTNSESDLCEEHFYEIPQGNRMRRYPAYPH